MFLRIYSIIFLIGNSIILAIDYSMRFVLSLPTKTIRPIIRMVGSLCLEFAFIRSIVYETFPLGFA